MCSAVYPEILYIIEGIFETVVCIILIFLTRSIVVYIHKWENSESENFNKNKYNLADYWYIFYFYRIFNIKLKQK